MKKTQVHATLVALLIVVGALALHACGKSDGRAPGASFSFPTINP